MPHPKTPPTSLELRQAADADQAVHTLVNFRGPLRTGIFDEDTQRDAATFLQALELVVEKLCIETASREYRRSFSQNYIELFREEPELYRIDVFNGCMDDEAGLVVNGEFMPFDGRVVRRRKTMQEALETLSDLLGVWQKDVRPHPERLKPSHEKLKRGLTKLDHAWAGFEESYIADLARIESASRTLLRTAIVAERRLRHNRPERSEDLRLLLDLLKRLSTMSARYARPRTGAYSEGVVKLARKIAAGHADYQNPGYVVATRFCNAFDDVREYLRGAERSMIRINPILYENRLLAQVMEAFDECHGLAATYLEPRMLSAIRLSTEEIIRDARERSKRLTAMVSEHEPELFLVLPRVIWLCYLRNPYVQVPVLRSLVPPLFASAGGHSPREAGHADTSSTDVQKLGKCYHETVEALQKGRVAGYREKDFGWEILLKRAIEGHKERILEVLITPDRRDRVRTKVERFMVELESRSMELQRHSALKWNQYTSVMIQCLSGKRITKEPLRPWAP